MRVIRVSFSQSRIDHRTKIYQVALWFYKALAWESLRGHPNAIFPDSHFQELTKATTSIITLSNVKQDEQSLANYHCEEVALTVWLGNAWWLLMKHKPSFSKMKDPRLLGKSAQLRELPLPSSSAISIDLSASVPRCKKFRRLGS